jgi:hypothetical protein
MNHFSVKTGLLLAATMGFLGCGEKTEPKVEVTVGETAPVSVPVDALGTRYEATLAQGIEFKKPGYPNFLVGVKGVSGHEPWGRWSDSKEVIFKFKQPLPTQLTLALTGGAMGPNIGKAFKIKIGSEEREMIFKGDPFKAPATQRIEFKLNSPSDTIQITVPEPSKPPSGDARMLGIGLISLQIEN